MQKIFRGSALVYTLIMMMLLLVSALALVTTTVIQQRGAGGTGNSLNAFQAANDGFEDLIARYKHASGTTLSAIGSCTNASGVGTISQSVGGRDYVATFQKKDALGNLVSASCADNLSDIELVKVVATVGSSTRAIETAFATTCTGKWEKVYANDSSGNTTFGTKAALKQAIDDGADIKVSNDQGTKFNVHECQTVGYKDATFYCLDSTRFSGDINNPGSGNTIGSVIHKSDGTSGSVFINPASSGVSNINFGPFDMEWFSRC